MSTATQTAAVFDPALARAVSWLELTDGRRLRLPVHDWHATATAADGWLLDRCTGPTVDLGCGPGRLAAALVAAGVPTLGVDQSPQAVRLCRARGAVALRGDVLAALPGEGRWAHALLADGNIGIGGHPAALLRRAGALLAPGGSALVETDPTGSLWCGSARLRGGAGPAGPWFPWATLGPAALAALAPDAGMRIVDTYRGRRRAFAQLAGTSGG